MVILRKNTARYWVPLIVTLSILSTAASCPPKPTPDQQDQRLKVLAATADRTVQIVALVEAAQETEIALYESKVVPALTRDLHDKYQAAFVRFATIAEPQVKLLKEASTSELVRDQAIGLVHEAGNALVEEFKGTPSPVLDKIFATLRAVLAITGV